MRGIHKSLRANDRIRADNIRLIGEKGEQVGVVALEEGVKRAMEANLDLVEVAPDAAPPVCRIMDFSKYKYDQAKRAKEAHKRQKSVHVKEIKLKTRIGEHDYQVKLRHLRKFLEEGDRVKVTLMFRGREITHPEIGRRIVERMAKEVGDIGEVEREPTKEGRDLIMILTPK